MNRNVQLQEFEQKVYDIIVTECVNRKKEISISKIISKYKISDFWVRRTCDTLKKYGLIDYLTFPSDHKAPKKEYVFPTTVDFT